MDIKVELDGDEIAVSKRGTDFEIVFGRPRGEPNLFVKRSWVSSAQATPAVNEFRRIALQAAIARARELGWIT